LNVEVSGKLSIDTAPPRSPAIEARGLSKAFDGRPANDKINFRAIAGQIHAVLGENGAGKSTLISMLSGTYRPDDGDILVGGKKVVFRSPQDALRAGIGVVHQELKLIDNLPIIDNVILGTGLRPNRAAKDRLIELAHRAGFDIDPDWPIHILSIGQRQQIEILKLLFRDLDILVFDEPTAVLGEAQINELFGILAMLKRQGKTIILITHRLREVRAIADRLTILRHGRVIAADWPPAELSDAAIADLMVGTGALLFAEEARPSQGKKSPRLSFDRDRIMLAFDNVHIGSLSGSGLRGVSLVVRRGEVLGVAGLRGNGQRELAEAAAGLLVPSAGRIERISTEAAFIPGDRLGMGLARALTVGENLALRSYRHPPVGKWFYKDVRALRRQAEHLIERYEIPIRHDMRVTRLSGGGLQRVVVARELARRLPLLVAAQPTRGLDIRSASFVRQQLRMAAERGAAVLVVSEDLDELMNIADRILVLHEGRVTASLERPSFDRRTLGALIVGGQSVETDHATLAV
jgi:general nucleoside transport system ATP-binding protein